MNMLYSENVTQFNNLIIPKVFTFLKILEMLDVISNLINLLYI